MHGEPETFSVSLVSTSTPTKCVMRAADGSKLERFKFHLLILSPTPARNAYLQEQPTQRDGQKTGSRRETPHLLLGVGVWGVKKTLRRSLCVGTGVRGSESSVSSVGLIWASIRAASAPYVGVLVSYIIKS